MSEIHFIYNGTQSATDYLYQCRLALIEELRHAYSASGIQIAIEKFDDVSFEKVGAALELRLVLNDGEEGGRSAAEGQWENDELWGEVAAIRWNASAGTQVGNPRSRELATWFIIPQELEQAVRNAIASLPNERSPS